MSTDTPELEALFDTIADERRRAERDEGAKPAAVAASSADAELEALFDSISEERRREIAAGADVPAAPAVAPAVKTTSAGSDHPITNEELYERVGVMTRQLHEALRALGYDQVLNRAAQEMPETRDRLGYIARLTGQAAERALASVEVGQQLQEELRGATASLSERWEAFFSRRISLEEFKSLVHDTRGYLAATQGKADATSSQLSEIMMAQDFHDLTGQVINRLTKIVQDFEQQMLRFLVELAPPAKRAEIDSELEGPVINPEGRSDVVQDQAQVDDLLESLGF